MFSKQVIVKKRRVPILPIISLLAAFLCMGWADDWEGIRATSAGLTSISAEFIQEKHMKILVHPLISKGVFHYQRPESLRWEYQSPIQSILLMHNGKTKRYFQGDKGLIEDSGASLQSMQIVSQEIAGFLSGRFDENPLFQASLEPGRKIVLAPKEESFSRIIQRIELVLSDQPGMIDSVNIYESEDSYTKLMFKNAVLNQKLPDSLFVDR